MVSTWSRFWLFAVFFVVFLAYIVVTAARDGWQSTMGAVFFLASFQVMTLYSLRRLYLKQLGRDQAATCVFRTKMTEVSGRT